MVQVDVELAADWLDELIERACRGEVVRLSINGEPVARLVPEPKRKSRGGRAASSSARP